MPRNTRRVALLVVLALCVLTLCSSAASDWPVRLSQMTDDELVELREALDAELTERGLEIVGAKRSAPTDASPLVWITRSGKKYHSINTCSNMKNPSQVSLETAKGKGLTPCKKCNPPE